MSQMYSDGGLEPVEMLMKKWRTLNMEPFKNTQAANEFIERVERLAKEGYLSDMPWGETMVLTDQSRGEAYIMYTPHRPQ